MKNKSLYTEGAWIIASQIATAIGTLALIKTSTELLEPSSYGQLSILLTIAFFISQVAIGGISVATSRYYTTANEIGDLKSYLFIICKYAININIIVLTIVILIIATSQVIIKLNDFVTIALAVHLGIVASTNSVLFGLLNSARDRRRAAFGQAGEIILRLLIILTVANLTQINSIKLIGCYIGASVIILIILLNMTIKMGKNNEEKNGTSENWEIRILKFAIPFMPWNLVVWLQQSTDKWALAYYENLREVGIYSVLYQVGYSSISMLFSMGIRFIQPILYEKVDKSIKSKKNEGGNCITEMLVKKTILFGLFIQIITILFHTEIFKAVVTGEYTEYSHYLPWITFAAIFHGIGEIYLLKMQAQLTIKKLSIVKSFLGFVGMIISIVGIKTNGFNGLIVAMVVFSLISAISMRYFSNEK